MNTYEVVGDDFSVEVKADFFIQDSFDLLDFWKGKEQEDHIASFKKWNYVRKIEIE